MSNLWLILYFLAWVLTLVWYQSRKKCFDVGSFILSSYCLFSLFSIFLYNSSWYSCEPIKCLPFVYLYAMLFIATYPVMQFNTRKITSIQRPTMSLLVAVSSVAALVTLAGLPSALLNMKDGLFRILVDTTAGAELYQEAEANFDTMGDGVSNMFGIFSNAFSNITVFLSFYLLTVPSKKLRVLKVLMFLSCLVLLISPISMGSRGDVIQILVTVIVAFLLFRPFMPKKVRRISRVGLIVMGAFISVFIGAITISRFSISGNVGGSLVRYIGEENINFNNYAFDNGGLRYGDRTFNLFKMPFFPDTPKNFIERRAKYANLHINDDVFSTFVGDFVFDFGPVIAFLIFLAFNILLLKLLKTRGGKVPFHSLILLFFPICVCAQGGMTLYSFADISGGLRILLNIALYLVFYLDLYLKCRSQRRFADD